jgi:hypothetical protein
MVFSFHLLKSEDNTWISKWNENMNVASVGLSKWKKTIHPLFSDLSKWKNIHVLSADLDKWKKHSCVVFRLNQMEK